MPLSPSVFIQLHGPAGNPLFIRQQDVIAVLQDTNDPAHTLVYLSNGQQWTVKEAVAEVLKHV